MSSLSKQTIEIHLKSNGKSAKHIKTKKLRLHVNKNVKFMDLVSIIEKKLDIEPNKASTESKPNSVKKNKGIKSVKKKSKPGNCQLCAILVGIKVDNTPLRTLEYDLYKEKKIAEYLIFFNLVHIKIISIYYEIIDSNEMNSLYMPPVSPYKAPYNISNVDDALVSEFDLSEIFCVSEVGRPSVTLLEDNSINFVHKVEPLASRCSILENYDTFLEKVNQDIEENNKKKNNK